MKISETKRESFAYLHNYKKQMLMLIIIIVFGIGISSSSPILYGGFLDALEKSNGEIFKRYLFLYLILSICTLVLSFFESVVAQTMIYQIDYNHQTMIFKKLLRTKVSCLDKLEYGRLATNISSDISTIVSYAIEIITTFIFVLLNFVVPLAFTFYLNVKMAVLALVFLPISMLIYRVFKEKLHNISLKSKKLDDQYNSFLVNSIFNITSIKAFRIESTISSKFNVMLDHLFKLDKEKVILMSSTSFLNNSVQSIFETVLILVASIFIFHNDMTIGTLITFTMYSSRLFGSINTIQKIHLDEQPVKVAIRRLEDLKTSPDELYEKATMVTQNVTSVSIKMENVSFSYASSDNSEIIFDNLNLEIYTNGFYSIVGENGAGKTTLMKLLMNFYQPALGEIYLNGKSYSNLTVDFIRRYITYIPKEPFVLNDTIFENIRLYNDCDEITIMDVCRRVGLSNFIQQLPNGLHTQLREGNDILSSGMMQKLSFARAILHPSEIYLVDEITSDLDGKAEHDLLMILKELSKHSIVISISHRRNAVIISDMVFMLENHKISDYGTYNELLNRNESFTKLFIVQN